MATNKKHLNWINTPLTISLVLFSCLLSAQSPNQQNNEQAPIERPSANAVAIVELEHFIDGFVAGKISDFDPPGMTVSVVLGDQKITKGYGIANAETGELNNQNTLFRIGSISKLFVWLSAHMLADEGKLDLDAPINSYLEGFAIPDAFDRQITMRDLMSHRPGFEDNLRDFVDPDRDISIEQAVERNIPLRVAPAGERASYSNTGSNMAAYVVERISGVSFFEFVQNRILKPTGLNSTTLRDPAIERNAIALEERMAKPHKIENGVPVVINYMAVRPQEPVGAVAMDAIDAGKFMRLLLNDTRYEGGRLLSQQAWDRITSPAFDDALGSDDMGWGFMLNDVDGLATVGHGGATQFLSWMFVIPELDMGVFVSSNMNSSDARGERLAWSIVRQIAGTGSIQSFLAREGNAEEAAAVAGDYLNNRRPFSRGASLFGLGTDIRIRATEDGYLIMPGAKETRYAPLGNDVWVNKDGMRLRVVKDSAGKVLRLHGGFGSSTLERISFMSTKNALLIGFGGTILLLLTSLMGMYYRLGRELAITSFGQKLRWVTVATVVTWSIFFISFGLGVMALVNMDITTIDESPFPAMGLKVAFFFTVIVCIQTLIHLLSLGPVWTRSGWTVWQRIHFTLFGLISLFAVYLLYHWNLVAGSIYGL